MTQTTDGLARYVVYGAHGHVMPHKTSRPLNPSVLDNEGPPQYVFNNREEVGDTDQPVTYNVKVDGREDQVIASQFYPKTAALVTDQADSALTLLQMLSYTKADGKWIPVPIPLTINERITPDGANNTRSHAAGKADGNTIPQRKWDDYARWAPGPNELWYPWGRWTEDFHDDQV